MSEHTRLKPKSSLSPTDSFQPAIAPPSSNFSSQTVNATVNTPINTTVPEATQLASPEQSIPALDEVPMGHDLSRFSIYPKLTVSQPNDPAEREADRVADAVIRMPEARSRPSQSLQPKLLGHDFSKISIFPKHQPTDPSTSILPQLIQRQCDACEDEEDEHLMRKENSAIVQRDETSSSPSIPGFQLTPPSLLQPPDPASRYNMGLKLHLDPQMQAIAMQHAQQQLDPAALKPTLAQLSLGTLPTISPNPSSASRGATSPVPNPLPPSTPAPTSPAVSSDKEPDPPRAATATDFMKAVLKVPEIDGGLTTLQTRVGDRITQDWQRLSTGEQIGVVSTTVLIGTGALAGVLSDPAARRLALDQLNGQTLPVPGVNWLRLEINTGGDNLMLGMHVDIGRLLPPSLGFGSSSPTAIGSPPQPEPAVPGQRMIQRVGSSEGSVQGDIGQRIQSASGGGGKLDEGVQQHLEQNLGADLSSVRIHTDGEADRLSKSVNAIAFTTGQDIFFSAGSYNPRSSEGKHLIAHEVVHTVQQANGAVAGTPTTDGVSISDPSDSFEQEAEQVAGQVMSMPDTATQQSIQREKILEEGEIHTKRSLQRSPDVDLPAGSNLESRLSSNRGEESPLFKMKQEGAAIVASQGLVVQRFEPSEHKFMGDEGSKTQTGSTQTVELAKDYFVSFGDITAMAGDYFKSVGEIKDLAKENGKGKGTREEIEFVRTVKIHGHKEQEKSFSDSAQKAVMERYYTLAGSNASHFTQPLGADKTANSINNFGSYHDNHENALKLAARAGVAKTSINDAMLQEAFASHFLTDAFSAGHIRTERVSIPEWWNPRVPMFWINLKLFIAEQMAYYINEKTTVAGTVKTVQQLWETVRETLEKKKLPTLTFGDFVSGALHDYDSEKGVATQHGKLLGDGQLRDEKGNPIIGKATGAPLPAAVITENAGINAVRLSLREVEKAYALGPTKSEDDVVAALRNGGLYTAEKLWPKAKPDAEQESKRPKWQQDSVGTLLKDPAMKEAIEIFGRNKAKELKEAIPFEDETFLGMTVVSAKLQLSGFQERVIDPLTSNPSALLERIINYTPNTGGGFGGGFTDANAREYVKKAKAEGALSKLTQQQRSKLIRDMISGSCGDEDEQAINDIITDCGVSEMTELVRSLGGGNISKGINYLDSGIDGAEWTACKNLLRRSPELAKEL